MSFARQLSDNKNLVTHGFTPVKEYSTYFKELRKVKQVDRPKFPRQVTLLKSQYAVFPQ